MWRARTYRQKLASDAILGAAVAFYGQLEVWLPSIGQPGSLPGQRWAISTAWLVMAGCVAFRRRAPFAALAVASVASLLEAAVYGAPEGFGSFLPMLILFYSVAAYEDVSLALTGLGIALALTLTQAYLDPLNKDDTSNLVASFAFSSVTVVAWGCGFLVHGRRRLKAKQAARVLHAEKQRAEVTRAAVADERARIARELHDVVSHSLGIVVVQAGAADELLAVDAAATRVAIEGIRRTAREGLIEMRRMLGVLRSLDGDGLDVQPGLANLHALADEVTAAGLPVQLSIEPGGRAISAGVAISTYRIVQESLTNALKHAHATRVEVSVKCGETLELEVEDDGIGPGANPQIGRAHV